MGFLIRITHKRARTIVLLATLMLCNLFVAKPATAHEYDYTIIDILLPNGQAQTQLRIQTHITSLVLEGHSASLSRENLLEVASMPDQALSARTQQVQAALAQSFDVVRKSGSRPQITVTMPTAEAIRQDAERMLEGPAPSPEIHLQLPPLPADESVRISVPAMLGKTLVRYHCGADLIQMEMLAPGEWSSLQTCVAGSFSMDRAMDLFREGFLHVVPVGWDHILLIVLLGLVVSSLGSKIVAASIFTAGHAMALLFASMASVPLAAGYIEVLIALSVGLMALHVWKHPVPDPKTVSWHITVLLPLGILHGFGFAGVFLQPDIFPQSTDTIQVGTWGLELIVSIVSFSIGIDVAHVFVLLVTALCLKIYSTRNANTQLFTKTVAATTLLIATVWTVQRIALL